MRAISLPVFKILNGDLMQPIDLLEIKLVGANSDSILRFTNAGYPAESPLIWDGHPYISANMVRGSCREIVATDVGNAPAVTVTVSNVGKQMADLLGTVEIEGARATIRECDRRLIDNPKDARVIKIGEIRSPQLNEMTLVFQIIDIMAILDDIKVPRRRFQSKCNATFGSQACGVNLRNHPNTIQTTALAGTNAYVVYVPSNVMAAAGQADPSEFWINGWVLFTDGPAALQWRPIQRVESLPNGSGRFFLNQPFLSNPGMNPCIIRRGCPKTVQACVERQGQALNHKGFPTMPSPLETPVIIERPDGLI